MKKTILALGDSQSELVSNYGTAPERMWTSMLSKRLNAIGRNTQARVFARSGDTTNAVLGKSDIAFLYDTPWIGIVYVGVNDPGSNVTSSTAQAGSTSTTVKLQSNSASKVHSYVGNVITTTGGTGSGQTKTIIAYDPVTFIATVDTAWSVTPDATTTYTIAAPTQAQQQANQQAIIKILKYRVTGLGSGIGASLVYWLPSMLPENGDLGQRYVVMNDNSTTGGAALNNSGQHANITGDYSAAPVQSVWEFRNPQAGEAGWARVAIAGTPAFLGGLNKVITISTNYQNWTSGGDNYNTNTSTGTQYASYVPVRAAAQAAALAEGTAYCDLYDFQSKLINGGVFLGNTIISETAQGSNSWHYTANNQHHNAYGHDTVARAAYLTILVNNW